MRVSQASGDPERQGRLVTHLAASMAVVVAVMTVYAALTFSSAPQFIAMVVGGSGTWSSIAMTIPAAVLVIVVSARIVGPPMASESQRSGRCDTCVPIVD